MTIAALIVAAGRGTRAMTPTAPKQYIPLAGLPVLARTVAAFLSHPAMTTVQVVIHPDDAELYAASVPTGDPRLAAPVAGRSTRQGSVHAGLQALQAAPPDIVMIHDAARPLIDHDTISAVLAALGDKSGAIAAVPATDTLKRATPNADVIAETIDRTGIWRALTPQAFHFEAILAAHATAAASGRQDFTDDASIAESAGLDVALVATSPTNLKITTPEDFKLAERLLQPTPALPDIRTGQGFDVHKFAAGDHVILCGVPIPHTQSLAGHSDADVAMHALTDAILGAIADGDIGQHFPPIDEQWRGARSDIFLADAARRVMERGGRLANVDVTIICEQPRIGPHRDAMRARLAEILELDTGRVAVKATTSEGLGFTGRREGIAALATATVILPPAAPA